MSENGFLVGDRVYCNDLRKSRELCDAADVCALCALVSFDHGDPGPFKIGDRVRTPAGFYGTVTGRDNAYYDVQLDGRAEKLYVEFELAKVSAKRYPAPAPAVRVPQTFAGRMQVAEMLLYPPVDEEADTEDMERPGATPQGRVFDDIRDERARQDLKWGEQNHPSGALSKIAADAAREECDRAFERGFGTWGMIATEELAEALAETDPVQQRAELVQLAAVVVAWIECLDRRAGK